MRHLTEEEREVSKAAMALTGSNLNATESKKKELEQQA
jgi:hypothetical protein